jgi:transcriptional regulator with XRE-family HTH domain
MKDKDTLVKELERVRLERGHSKQHVARELGVAYSTLWEWIHTDRTPTYESAMKIDDYIGEDEP